MPNPDQNPPGQEEPVVQPAAAIEKATGDFIGLEGSKGTVIQPQGDVYQDWRTYITNVTEETAYKVSSLLNPYPGLRSFTSNEVAAFGGRDRLCQESVEKIADPLLPHALTFITGASGSGKSSFAQAGLIPSLEKHYRREYQRATRSTVFRPSSRPLAMLADRLVRLGLPAPNPTDLETSQGFSRYLREHKPADQVSLIVVDQFEELFTQSAGVESNRLLILLSGLPDFKDSHMHFIATLRSDYLGELFDHQAVWDVALRNRIELRAMNEEELKEAIVKPLLAAGLGDERYRQVRFEEALVVRLAHDTAADATYLPLLQVTLENLWKGGLLKLEKYTDLGQAISKRADDVYDYSDYDAAQPASKRPKADQALIMAMLLDDLIDYSPDDNPGHDKRQAVLKTTLAKGSPERMRLIEDLVKARLLSVDALEIGTQRQERVEIIHDTLLNKWERLRTEISSRRDQYRSRTRFKLNRRVWENEGKPVDRLLSGVDLREALQLLRSGDIALQDAQAREFLQLSLAQDRLTRSRLRGLFGGAVGFSLAYFLVTWPQVTSDDRFFLAFASIIRMLPGALAGFGLMSGLAYFLARPGSQKMWIKLSLGGLCGTVAFSLALLFNAILNSVFDPLKLLLILAEGALWGFACGACSSWALATRKPAWQAFSAAALAGGFAILAGESIGNAFLRPNNLADPAAWLVFLAGALMPLSLLAAIFMETGRRKSAQ